MSKFEKIIDLTIVLDRKLWARVPTSCAPFFRTLLSCQIPLNCHMGQIFPLAVFWVFRVPPYWTPYFRWNLGGIQKPIWRYFVMKLPSKNFKNHESLLFDYSVRQKIGDPGSISTQNMFPLTAVVPKPPQLPYGAKYMFFQVFRFFVFSHEIM